MGSDSRKGLEAEGHGFGPEAIEVVMRTRIQGGTDTPYGRRSGCGCGADPSLWRSARRSRLRR
jgi:hypothetical protein